MIANRSLLRQHDHIPPTTQGSSSRAAKGIGRQHKSFPPTMRSQQTAAKGELVANRTEAAAVGAVNWSPTETTVHLLTTYSYFYLGVGVWQQANLQGGIGRQQYSGSGSGSGREEA